MVFCPSFQINVNEGSFARRGVKKVGQEAPCVTPEAERRMIFQPLLLFNIHSYWFSLILVFYLSESALPVKFWYAINCLPPHCQEGKYSLRVTPFGNHHNSAVFKTYHNSWGWRVILPVSAGWEISRVGCCFACRGVMRSAFLWDFRSKSEAIVVQIQTALQLRWNRE